MQTKYMYVQIFGDEWIIWLVIAEIEMKLLKILFCETTLSRVFTRPKGRTLDVWDRPNSSEVECPLVGSNPTAAGSVCAGLVQTSPYDLSVSVGR